MTQEQFDELLERRLKLTRQVLGKKAEEYAGEEDRLYNFKVACLFNRTDWPNSPAKALWGMLVKHLVSVMDIVNREAKGREETFAVLDEKLGDCINYFILLEALLKESRLVYVKDLAPQPEQP